MSSIFCDENIPNLAEAIVDKDGEIVSFYGRGLVNRDLVDNECVALFVRSTTKVNEELLDNTKVEFVATATSGADHIDEEYLRSKHIEFSSALGANSNSVAEYVIYGILKHCISENINLSGLTIGIVGFGNVGSKVAYYAHKLGLNVLVNDPPLQKAGFVFPNYCRYLELNDLLAASDILTNHTPLTNKGEYATVNLIDDEQFTLLKPTVLLIHCSRGGVINESALSDFLKANSAANLIIDVFVEEPRINKYLSERAIISTPHIAGYSKNGKIEGVKAVVAAYEKFTETKQNWDAFSEYEINSKSDFDGDYRDVLALLANINAHRKIEDDSIEFKKIINLVIDKQKTAFDYLRKNYPTRYEYLRIK
jgi:erythronate-4-phosphate dehydrogenase